MHLFEGLGCHAVESVRGLIAQTVLDKVPDLARDVVLIRFHILFELAKRVIGMNLRL